MPTNLAIDEILLSEAQKAGGLKTKKATVNQALRECIQKRKQRDTLKQFGQIDFDPDHDCKKGRHRS
ncbi:MAG TPA: type II toxin-antitoxin system VapB family antitoxin [candidate division Zixibacteria bacterium]|jgi:Arc/MetJ family transcription regulator|nr:type II toxin-antitoxin system VapB family antitoxin [candidate division Zixibacteria bacterium]